MRLKQLTIDGFRNYRLQSFETGQGFNLLAGRNAQGKSNLMEAIYSLSIGRSFRTGREEEVIGQSSSFARVAGIVSEEDDTAEVEVLWEKDPQGHVKKTVKYNHKAISRLSDFIDKAPMVLLSHDDLEIIRGEPEIRRRLTDLITGRLTPGYLSDLKDYNRFLNEKNRLLKLPPKMQDLKLKEVYQEKLAQLGSSIILRRLKTLEVFKGSFKKLYNKIFNLNPPDIEYFSSITGIGELSLKGVLEAFRKTQKKLESAEKVRKFTLAGPHRDDLQIKSFNGPLKKFASMGEIRSAAVIIKLAEIDIIARGLNREPVILIDDCLNEFDGVRIDRFFDYLLSGRQVFYTATRYFPHFDKIRDPRVFEIENGVLTPCSLCRLQSA